MHTLNIRFRKQCYHKLVLKLLLIVITGEIFQYTSKSLKRHFLAKNKCLHQQVKIF